MLSESVIDTAIEKAKNWDIEIPSANNKILAKNLLVKDLYTRLKDSGEVVTSLSSLRKITNTLSKKYGVPIKISAAQVEKYGQGSDEALYTQRWDRNGKLTVIIYVHPYLQYYTEDYIRAIVLHELHHASVEKRWEKLKN